MFDQLIVSDEQGAEFKGRSRYFMVSTVVVGILFATAVVFSLYAADIGLGSDEFEISMMLAPVTPDAPERPKPEPMRKTSASQNDVPMRNANVLRPDESPLVPNAVSVVASNLRSRPPGRFLIGTGPETDGRGDPNSVSETGKPVGSGSGETSDTSTSASTTTEQPPPIKTKPPVPPMISKGVINGQAKSLPTPPYPAPARMVGAQGAVSVQITIDETGKVISSRAINGHPLLRSAAEKAAWSAKFSPTYLSEIPVKVTGVIVYNFKKS